MLNVFYLRNTSLPPIGVDHTSDLVKHWILKRLQGRNKKRTFVADWVFAQAKDGEKKEELRVVEHPKLGSASYCPADNAADASWEARYALERRFWIGYRPDRDNRRILSTVLATRLPLCVKIGEFSEIFVCVLAAQCCTISFSFFYKLLVESSEVHRCLH